MTLNWPAPNRTTGIDKTVTLPGSKSHTNRALVLAALASGPSTIHGTLHSRDTLLMCAALSGLGATISHDGPNTHVEPISSWNDATVDCGLAGTVMRFVPLVAALGDSPVTFDGDPYARKRPMTGTIDALRTLGVTVSDEDRGTLPFTVHPPAHISGGDIAIDSASSSQFISAVLLVAPRFTHGVRLRNSGAVTPSIPHIDMTIAALRDRGVNAAREGETWVVEPGDISPFDDVIEPDLSNAGAFIAGALATGGSVRIARWPEKTHQAGAAWEDLAVQFGGIVQRSDDAMEFRAGDSLHSIDVDLGDVGELTPVIAALAAIAEGTSHLRNIAHLRGHETDRLAALATELTKLGIDVVEEHDTLHITGGTPRAAVFATYDDHRLAHAGAVLGLVTPGLEVENIETTSKTYPTFPSDWQAFAS